MDFSEHAASYGQNFAGSVMLALVPAVLMFVLLRFFGGLSVEETASVLKVSPATVMGDWRLAKAWLQREMRGGGSHDA